MKNLIKKTLEILKKKDKINIVFAIFLSIIRSILEVLGIGLILPILHFTTSQDKNNFIYDYFPYLKKLTDHQLILLLVFVFVCVYFIKTLFLIFTNWWNTRFVNRLYVSLTMAVLKKYLNKNYIFFLENHPSFLIRNISSETSLFSLGLIGNLITIITHAVFIIFTCLFLVVYKTEALYVIFIILSVSVFIVKITSGTFKKWGEVRQEESAKGLKKLNEMVGNIKEIILFEKKKFFAEDFSFHSKKLAKASIFRDTTIGLTAPIIEFLGVLIFFVFFYT